MKSRLITGWTQFRLRNVLLLFFLLLLIPTAILVMQAYSQLKWESFHQQRVLAETLVGRINHQFSQILDKENARSFTDYSFLNIIGGKKQRFLQRSSLSSYPVNSAVPGAIAYFQVDSEGRLSSPLLPEITNGQYYGLSDTEIEPRQKLFKYVQRILHDNRLVAKEARSKAISDKDNVVANGKGKPRTSSSMPAPVIVRQRSGQAGFDTLQSRAPVYSSKQAAGKADKVPARKVAELKLKQQYKKEIMLESNRRQEQISRSEKLKRKRMSRLEKNVLPKQKAGIASTRSKRFNDRMQVRMFESEIESFDFSMLDGGYFILYRKVWHDKKRYIQGMLIDADQFLKSLIDTSFNETALSFSSNLIVAFKGNILRVIKGAVAKRASYDRQPLQGMLLLKEQLPASQGQLELLFNIKQLPPGPGSTILVWLSLVLFVVLLGGFYLLYRLGLKQINLIQQQQNFVASVSHELKTPLTSIRMYGEMLREGWAPEEKRKIYYDYIYNESERLTRLINNVLQLARMTRNDLQARIKTYQVSELMDQVMSRLSSQVEQSGFLLKFDCDESLKKSMINVDSDFFVQIFINLLDNAIKFSSNADCKQIDLRCQEISNGRIQFSLRDYGPGIGHNQLRKIFSLFYRSENELTRKTVGTGIGLALVKELTQKMNGVIDVVNVEPGAEFRLVFTAQ